MSQEIKEKKECPVCDGKGYLTRKFIIASQQDKMQCPKCDGFGIVKIINPYNG